MPAPLLLFGLTYRVSAALEAAACCVQLLLNAPLYRGKRNLSAVAVEKTVELFGFNQMVELVVAAIEKLSRFGHSDDKGFAAVAHIVSSHLQTTCEVTKPERRYAVTLGR